MLNGSIDSRKVQDAIINIMKGGEAAFNRRDVNSVVGLSADSVARVKELISKAASNETPVPGLEVGDFDLPYIDNRDITGKLADVFQQTLSFVLANTGTGKDGQSGNSLGQPEVPRIVWEELLVNALIHRDYFVSVPVRVSIFSDRVEIVSAGHLPNILTLENNKAGNFNI